MSRVDLSKLASERFGALTRAENELLLAAPEGRVAYCGETRDQEHPMQLDNPTSDTWPNERKIRAALIRWLCVDRAISCLVDPQGIQLYAASITDTLDLSFSAIPFPLRFISCRVMEEMRFSSCEIPALKLENTRTRSIIMDSATITGDLFLREGFRADGTVLLTGARVGGDLSCIGGTFVNPHGTALDLDCANIEIRVFLCGGFHVEGDVSLRSARIRGDVYCTDGTFHNVAGEGNSNNDVPGESRRRARTALNATGARIGGSLFLAQGFNAEGMVDLRTARIDGALVCRGGHIRNPPMAEVVDSGIALRGDGAIIGDAVFLNDGFHAEGLTRLAGAQVGIDVDCSGGIFDNPPKSEEAPASDGTGCPTVLTPLPNSGTALEATEAKIGGSLLLSRPFRAKGLVNLRAMRIAGALVCTGASIRNQVSRIKGSGVALQVDGATIGDAVFLNDGFRAEGVTRLVGTHVGIDVDCRGGTFINPVLNTFAQSGSALVVSASTLTGSIYMGERFQAIGTVALTGTRVGGDLNCAGGIFSNPGIIALDLSTSRITGNLVLGQASTGVNKASFTSGSFLLDGSVYGAISGGPTNATSKLQWLGLIGGSQPFASQPFQQLAKVLADSGDDSGARTVLYTMEKLSRREDVKRLKGRRLRLRALGLDLWSRLLNITIGYGRHPEWAFYWLLILVLFGWSASRIGYRYDLITPTERSAFCFFESHRYPPPYYEGFQPFAYSLENSFPLLKLGQVDRWTTNPRQSRRPRWAEFLRCFRLVQICLGWVLATFFVAGVTGVVRKHPSDWAS